MDVKTNAMRILENKKIEYKTSYYEVDEKDLSGETAAKKLGISEEIMFKTLVLKGDKTGNLVACIPVCAELNLKELAAKSGNKKVEMVPMKDILSLTGYIRGGCSPIGMKKQFKTYIDETIELCDTVYVSAGQRGVQIILKGCDLVTSTEGMVCEIGVFR